MALLPTIPTSFVPHSTEAPRHFRTDFAGAFSFFAYAVLSLVFLLALGVFFYGRILAVDKSAKDHALAAAETAIDTTTVANFIRLRDRLTSSDTLLGGHISFSSFFSSLEKILPTTVRFNALRLSPDATSGLRMEGAGIAKSFNALAATSEAFAIDGRIKDAIFSNIVVNRDNSVSFTLAAMLDPKIVTFSP